MNASPDSPAAEDSLPIRVAFVITELEVGGAERCLTQLVTGLNRERFAPVVYSLWDRPVAGRTELVDRLEETGVPIQFVNLRRAWQLRGGVRRLQRALREQQPQLIQTFLFHANVLGAYAGWRLGVPHIVQGIRVADRSAWRMMMERTSSRVVERIVCVSDAVRRFAEDEAGLPSEKLCVIPNGIDPARFGTPASLDPLPEWNLPAGRRFVSVIGRLHRQKGVDWFLSAAPQFLERLPDVDVVVVGAGPEEGELRNLAISLNLGSRVHFTGWVRDVGVIIRRSSLLALPSRWEGMPNVVLEGMVGELPVVARDVEGVRELLGDRADQQVVGGTDAGVFAERIVTILQDSRLAQELGQANHRRAATEFTIERMVARYEQLYSSLFRGR